MAQTFRDALGGDPTHASWAPGRVNVIGEHTDYNGLPVLPMALQRGIRIVLRPRDDGLVRLRNVAAGFEEVTFEISPVIDPAPDGHWGNYVRAPAQELARRFAVWRGFDGVVASDLPAAAGLSSSSALVNAVGLALHDLGEVGLGRLALADVMADAERYTGVRGGAMDQTISLNARAGHVCRIGFDPLKLRHVLVPEDWRFVVADTGVRAEKAASARVAYNQRTQECREALAALRDGLEPEPRRAVPEGYRNVIRFLGGTEAALERGSEILSGTLLKRFRHVVTEAARVDTAVDAILNADIMHLGGLMDASHGSLRSDFLVSSAVLDRTVETALEGGAAGARLTGAGWGGCVVALADAGTVDGVVEMLRTSPPPTAAALPPERRAFVALPSEGAWFGAWRA